MACTLREFKNPLIFQQNIIRHIWKEQQIDVFWASGPSVCEGRYFLFYVNWGMSSPPLRIIGFINEGSPGHTFIMSLWISSVQKTCRIIMIHKCNNFTTILKSVSIRFYNYRDKSSHKTFWVESLPHIWKCVLFLGFSQSVEFIARVFDPFLL